jgi:hypothetical protein
MSELLDLLTESVQEADRQLEDERRQREEEREAEEADFDAWAREAMPAVLQKAVRDGQKRLPFSAFEREGKSAEALLHHLKRICVKNGIPLVDVQGVDHIDVEALRRRGK